MVHHHDNGHVMILFHQKYCALSQQPQPPLLQSPPSSGLRAYLAATNHAPVSQCIKKFDQQTAPLLPKPYILTLG